MATAVVPTALRAMPKCSSNKAVPAVAVRGLLRPRQASVFAPKAPAVVRAPRAAGIATKAQAGSGLPIDLRGERIG